MLRKKSFLLSILVLTAGCAANISNETSGGSGGSDAAPLGPSKSRWSFELPGDGKPNGNGSIGPFCCTGQTAVVTDNGHDLGYGYFFDWKGQAHTDGIDSWMPDVVIRVAGVQDLADPSSPLEESEIDFDAGKIAAGSKKSAQAGDLLFTVTVEHVDVTAVAGDPDGHVRDPARRRSGRVTRERPRRAHRADEGWARRVSPQDAAPSQRTPCTPVLPTGSLRGTGACSRRRKF